MYENFILQQFENGKLEGYSWNVDDPEKVICIVHGIGEYGGRFDRVAEAFREKNMAVLAFDLRGQKLWHPIFQVLLMLQKNLRRRCIPGFKSLFGRSGSIHLHL